MASPSILGVVLAGGRSRRFGSDKAVAVWAGRTLVTRAADSLRSLCDDVVVVSSLHPDLPGVRTVPDTRPDEGPLAGIEAGLFVAEREDRDGVFVLACDMPAVDPEALRSLSEVFDGGRPVSAARAVEPGFEPLCAIYPASYRAKASRLLDAGERAAWRLFSKAEGEVVEVGAIVNVNTPDEWSDLIGGEEIVP
ncbi:MAG: molybdenum cofactor guanylyltransferase [Gemmatimonadota bacterium]